MEDKLEIWSLFSGAMGLDLGFEKAGLNPTLAVELDKQCCETIRANHPGVSLIEGSVSNISADDLRRVRNFSGDVELMIGGPPCQSFSPGGKRAALSDPRGNLIYEYMRLIAEVRPRHFLLENVANLVTAAIRHRKIADRPGKHWSLKAYEDGKFDHHEGVPLEADELSGTAVRQMLADLESLGYSVVFGILDSADYGAAQHRLRFVMMGSRDGLPPPLPAPTHGDAANGLRPFRTVGDVIADLQDSPGPHSEYTEAMAKYFRHVPPGGNWRHLPEDLKREAMGAAYESGGGKTGFFRRLAWGTPAPTITGRSNRKASAMCHPSANRPLSVWECARIQGFPDTWKITGSMAAQYMQIGNAVPVALGAACARSFRSKLLDGRQRLGRWELDMEMMLDVAVKRLRASARNKKSAPKTMPLFQESFAGQDSFEEVVA